MNKKFVVLIQLVLFLLGTELNGEVKNDSKKWFFVSSYGCCGSGMLYSFLSNFGHAVHLHERYPPEKLTYPFCVLRKTPEPHHFWFSDVPIPDNEVDNFTLVYIFRNPGPSQSGSGLFSKRGHQIFKVKNYLEIPSFEEYIRNGVDLLNYEEFFDNYVNKKVNKNYKIVAINYHKMWDNLPEVFKALDLPESEIKNFPKKVLTRECDENALILLDKMNESLVYKINSMPAATVLGPFYN